jgi:hypothetical protein
LKLVARNKGAASYTAMKKLLATIPEVKLPTNQGLKDKKEILPTDMIGNIASAPCLVNLMQKWKNC